MYDELVKRIWECAYGECFNCLQYTETTNASVCQKELMKQAADAIEELSKLNAEITTRELKARMEKPRWIPVTERLPEPYVEVLLYSGEDRYTGYMHNDKRFTVNASHYPNRPTHWAHLLPAPPKEET